jgi:hypothetical protein
VQGRSGTPGPGPYTVRMMALDVAALGRAVQVDPINPTLKLPKN